MKRRLLSIVSSLRLISRNLAMIVKKGGLMKLSFNHKCVIKDLLRLRKNR